MKTTWIVAICFILFLAGTTSVSGQTKTTPSKVVPKESPQKLLADSLYKMGEKYYDAGDSKKALSLFDKSLNIYQSIGESQKAGDCYSYMAFIYYSRGDYSKALSLFTKTVDIFKKVKDKKGVANALNSVGAVYYIIGNYPKALDFYKQAVVIQEEIRAEKGTAITTMNIGGIYSTMRDYDNAMKYFNQGNSIFKKLKDNYGIAKIFIETGYVHMKRDSFDKAFKDFSQSLTIAIEIKDRSIEIEALSNLGELFYTRSNLQKAQYYYNRCLENAKKVDNVRYEGISQIAIGNIFHQLKNHKDAVEKCKSGLEIAEKLGAIAVKKDACECLYKSYESLGNAQLALQYYKKTNSLDDSLQLKETSNKMMNMEFQKQQLADSVAFVKKEAFVEQKHQEEIRQKEKQRNFIIASLGVMLLVAAGLWSSLRLVRKSRAALSLEKDRSEALLLNILPADVAEELKAKGSVTAKDFELVSILFTDFKSFTQTAETMSPQSLVEEINVCFQAFDLISEKYQIEKIKTIGDAYMAAGGMAKADANALKNTVLAGLEMQAFVKQRAIENQQAQKPAFEMRLGIHAGPIVAGIVGVKKFQYDIWGDTVNTASRMESNGAVGKVNISETLYQILKDDVNFAFEARGSIEAKGKGEMSMYFVENKISC